MITTLLVPLISAHFVFAADATPGNSFSLEQLQSTANFLGERIAKPEAKLLKCDPDLETAKSWMTSTVHALLDSKVQTEAGRFERNPDQMLKRAKNCHKACTCNAFAAVLEASEAKLGRHPMHKEVTRIVERESKHENSLACAKAFKSFCGSELEKYLRNEHRGE